MQMIKSICIDVSLENVLRIILFSNIQNIRIIQIRLKYTNWHEFWAINQQISIANLLKVAFVSCIISLKRCHHISCPYV